jgi:hypothetical protein
MVMPHEMCNLQLTGLVGYFFLIEGAALLGPPGLLP